MRAILVVFLLTGAPFAAPENPAGGGKSAEEARPDEDRESVTERRRRVAENLKRFSWVEVGPRPEHEWIGEPITLSLRDADLVEVLRSFAKMTDVNLILDPAVRGTVTLELREVPWDQALYVILKANGLGMEISGNVWNMMPAEKLLRDVR